MKKNIKINFPQLNFFEFFTGKVEAKGHLIQYYPKKKVKNLLISFEGKVTKNKLLIKEYYSENNVNINRSWLFDQIDENDYIGTEQSVVGEVKVNSKDNYLNMNYIFKIVFWNFNLNIKIIDDMYLINKKEIINTTLVSKYNISLARSFLLYKKL